MKKCSRCNQEKDSSEFYTKGMWANKTVLYMPHCKACEKMRKMGYFDRLKLSL